MKRLTLSLGLLLICSSVFAVDITPLAINSPAPDFNLPGVDGKNHALHDYDSAKILVVIFTCNHCPTAQAYETRIKQMYADYKDKGVALVAINPNNPQAIRLDVRIEQAREPREDGLVAVRRRRRHEQLPVNELVLVSVVGQAMELLERPALDFRRHVHGHLFFGIEWSASMRRR